MFSSADTAFVLALSIIMLNTDLHNPAIKPERRMTKEGFRRNNRGISAGGDLEDSFLDAIFDRIQASPFTLKEDEDLKDRVATEALGARGASLSQLRAGAASGRRRRRAASARARRWCARASRLRQTKTQARGARGRGRARDGGADAESADAPAAPPPQQRGRPGEHCSAAARAEYVRPMFEVAWGPLIGAFSQLLETSSDGGRRALPKASRARCAAAAATDPTPRASTCSTRHALTTLRTVREMQPKHVAASRRCPRSRCATATRSATRGCPSCSARRSSRACTSSRRGSSATTAGEDGDRAAAGAAAPRRACAPSSATPAASRAEAARALDEGNALRSRGDRRGDGRPRFAATVPLSQEGTRPRLGAVQVSHAEIFDPAADDAAARRPRAPTARAVRGARRRPPGGRELDGCAASTRAAS